MLDDLLTRGARQLRVINLDNKYFDFFFFLSLGDSPWYSGLVVSLVHSVYYVRVIDCECLGDIVLRRKKYPGLSRSKLLFEFVFPLSLLTGHPGQW